MEDPAVVNLNPMQVFGDMGAQMGTKALMQRMQHGEKHLGFSTTLQGKKKKSHKQTHTPIISMHFTAIFSFIIWKQIQKQLTKAAALSLHLGV